MILHPDEELFASAYPDTEAADLSFAHAANAIGAFEITSFEASTSPWDEFLRGDDDALATVEIVGALEFFDAGCAACHSGSGLQGTGFANTGLAQFGPGKGHGSSGFDDLGRQGVTNDEADRYGFRIPMLANIALTAGGHGRSATMDAPNKITKTYFEANSSIVYSQTHNIIY